MARVLLRISGRLVVPMHITDLLRWYYLAHPPLQLLLEIQQLPPIRQTISQPLDRSWRSLHEACGLVLTTEHQSMSRARQFRLCLLFYNPIMEPEYSR
jgi:hypothetical protein